MKKLMKIGLVSSLGLALAIPACAQNQESQTRVLTSAQTSSAPIPQTTSLTSAQAKASGLEQSQTVTSAQRPILIGTLGTTSSPTRVATVIALSGAEAVSSTGHTK